jgi:hypothetical protein
MAFLGAISAPAAVSACDQRRTTGALPTGNCCRQKIVGLVAQNLGDWETTGGDEVREKRQLLNKVRIEVPTALTWRD